MSFPQEPLNATVQLQLTADGAWTDITDYALQRDGSSPPITITRGRPNESAQANPAQCQMQWNNRDGRFSRANPTGPYYGQFGRNTPVRVSVPASGTRLRFADDNLSYVATADSVNLQITGTIDVRIDLDLDSYEPCALANKWGSTGTAWCLVLNGDGTVTFTWNNGSSVQQAQSTQPIPNLGRIMIRAYLSTGSDIAEFYTAPNMAGSQTLLGSAVYVGSTAIAAAAGQSVRIGYSAAYQTAYPGYYGLQGHVYEFRVYNSSATLVADPVFTSQTAGASSFTDGQSNTWQITGTLTASLDNRSYRFHGECASLPQAQDPSGTDIWTPVTASGILRRLSQGNADIQSAMRQAIPRLTGNLTPVAYWPMEDLAGAQQLAAVIGPFPMQWISGTPTLASNSSFTCSQAIPALNGATITGGIQGYTGSDIIVRFLLAVPSSGDTTDGTILTITTTGTYDWALMWSGSGVILGEYVPGTGVVDTTVNIPMADNGIYMVSVEITPSGSDVKYAVAVMQAGYSTVTTESATSAAAAVGQATLLTLNADLQSALLSGTAIGQLYVQSAYSSLAVMAQPLAAYAGETAANRFARLCSENSIASRIYGYPNVSQTMGPQQIDTLANVLQSCEDADRGMIYEPSECLGLGYRTLSSLCNQAQNVTGAPLQLSWTSAYELGDGQQIVGVTDDDQYTVNDMTATRNNGSAYQYQLNDGSPMSISDPPVGVGDYAQQITVYVNSDGQLPGIAGWYVHTGTCDDERFPLIPLNLARTQLSGLVYSVQDMRLGGYLQITAPPAYLTPNVIKQIVAGTTEKLGGFFWQLAWQCNPETPYETIVAGDPVYGRVDTDGSTLASNAASGATSLSVATTSASTPLWTTHAGDVPFYIGIAGEQIEVTAVSGSSSPQTFTCTRSINGVVKAQSSGAAVSLWYPAIVALV